MTLAKIFGTTRLASDAVYVFDFSVTADDIKRTHELDKEFGWPDWHSRH